MRCGSSGHSHDTIAELRACPSSGYPGSAPAAPRNTARRPRSVELRSQTWDEIAAQVPAGWYATPSATGNNDYDFWQVDKPSEGKWSGRTFVSRVLGGHDNLPVRGRDAAVVLIAILREGTCQAMTTYGLKIGRCGKCNRTLTDKLSREIGIGPVCREKG
jgi:hypothetical protein